MSLWSERTPQRLRVVCQPGAIPRPTMLGRRGLSSDRRRGEYMFDHKPRLLVVDDDPQVLRAYARILQHDFTVESCADGTSALRRIAKAPCFDVILCDRYLAKGLSGQDVFESLSIDLQWRTVICSGCEPDEDDAFAAALGDRFFMKPGHLSALVLLLLRVARVPPQVAA